ncbi:MULTISPECIES: molecular chaperone TorD family protein [Filomicrobium]|uniref:TorD/DmsD family molecular chaperone n=1 Tax=Filomicrobium TaxID=119044 RepID=UPI0018D409CA|nr:MULTISPECIES: molecular chaperone TorD family protein [Filomicrobium]MCV0367964.1 molecular chaperone TorD family protein [Filomicrobium sp.]
MTQTVKKSELQHAAQLTGDESPLGQAISKFAKAAAATDEVAADDDFHDLFIGLGRGVLVPFASYYLTGFLHEKPLARLRLDMAALGIERDPSVKEPEDHIASVLEIMAGLVDGSLVGPVDLERQRKFFETHVASWAPYFFKDLSETDQSSFYAALGRIGVEFMEIEKRAFEYV